MAAGPLRVTSRVTIPEHELQWRFSRSSGPGGQSVNTSDTKVELSFDLSRSSALSESLRARAVERLGHRVVDGVLTITSSEHRSQLQNREAAQRRLAATLADALAPPPPARRPTKPSRSAKRKRVEVKRQRGEIKRLRRNTDD